MDNVSSRTATSGSPTGTKKGLIEQIKKINRLFALTVLVPTTIATVYYGLVASDVYVSESRFVVRSPQRQNQTSVVGALLQGTGFSRAQDDTYPVVDYIQSRDALAELNRGNYILNSYSNRGDIISRFNTSLDDSFEALWKYYGKHVVSVEFDSTSAITTLQVRAFTSKDAEKINQTLLEISERLVNRMNQRAAADTVEFAQREVNQAAAKAKDAAAALAAYRNSYTVFDPEKQSALQLQQVTSLQSQMFAAQTQLMQLQSISPQNPQIPVLKTNIESMQKQIQIATGGVTGGKDSLSQKAANYARLQLDAQFADKQLASAMTALESARGEAERKQLYLERLVQPNAPDVAIEPKRLKSVFEVFALGMIAWGVLSLLLAGVREHHD
ncbi:hypothetical protein KDW63_17695 [Burkholderia cenocepacia]|uniref:hypothetical protein n=1 Tax=Burkholderia cepacia complex TaxID=87882 RepID=UPI000981FCB7|nr:hypothetical protein [Burkholderia cenocepacia]AQQ27416.1 hypothetical protein A8E88_18015 [Burkholderia cenocepacia]MBR8296019.1 hypothetical protein [Burkholderia cenocepacia]MBR8409345.1 hypothetical protein [Burkholderia cenocepacia]ONW00595.1 hypothetical protein A8E89_01375 [Burkholderia cenocepacia]ONW09713.1 hypothetical protein A8E94_23610 [Burkholderia cenocepacia]